MNWYQDYKDLNAYITIITAVSYWFALFLSVRLLLSRKDMQVFGYMYTLKSKFMFMSEYFIVKCVCAKTTGRITM